MIDRAECARLKEGFSERATEAEKQMDALRERLDAIQHKTADTGWMERFRRYRNLTELDRTAVVTLIEHIMVYDSGTAEIIYRNQDEYAWQTDIARRVQYREAV